MFGVIKVHSFDPETEACLFNTYKEATKYLLKYWEDYYNEELAEQSSTGITALDEYWCMHSDEYAKVTWLDGHVTEFILFEISEPREF